jgi:solute carrier family 25 S-adenosylmethionine transporter 26
MITFTAQDWIQDQLRRRHDKKEGLTLLENTIVGMASALVAGVVTNPIDVVKTRMMTQAASNAEPYKSALDCAVTIFRNEGARKFYAGFGQRSVYMCGLWGITFALNGHFQKREVLVAQTKTSAHSST